VESGADVDVKCEVRRRRCDVCASRADDVQSRKRGWLSLLSRNGGGGPPRWNSGSPLFLTGPGVEGWVGFEAEEGGGAGLRAGLRAVLGYVLVQCCGLATRCAGGTAACVALHRTIQ
jgi:hypothetical protein